MFKSLTLSSLFVGSLCLLAPGLAGAWTPYGTGAYGPGGEPEYPGPQAQTPGGGSEALPYTPGYSYPAYGPPPGVGRGFPGMAGPGMGPSGSIQISREATPEAYVLTIHLRGIKPEEVQIQTRGQWMHISEIGSQQQVQEDTFDQGRGYMHSYSYSSGSASRQFSVPWDGDLSAMKREDSSDTIRVTIPRKKR
jgi:HSP20 family molecular chaperone IbpA